MKDNEKIRYSNFIEKLYNSPSSTPQDKERIVKLLLSEREKGFVTEEKVISLIDRYTRNVRNIPSNTEEVKGDSIHIHRPKDTYEFLKLFGGEDYGIKNLTHDFNGDFPNYDEFLKECRLQFDEAKRQHPNTLSSVLKRVEVFAFKENPEWYTFGWSDNKKKYNLGWSNKIVRQWCIDNQKHPKHNPDFEEEMIKPFKNIIQVRSDTCNLIKIIKYLKGNVFGNFGDVTVDDKVKEANFYTDVDALANAIQIIFKMIKEKAENSFNKPEVKICYDDSGNTKELVITHLGSISTKSPEDKDYLGGDMKSLKNTLWNLCNFEIRSNTQDGKAFKKTIMNENPKMIGKVEYLDDISLDGFSYILKFY